MKFLVSSLLFLGSFAWAQGDLTPATSVLRMEGREPNPSCEIVTNMTLDRGELVGPVVFLNEQVSGLCEIVATPNPRHYFLVHDGDNCGSKVYVGHAFRSDGLHEIEIVDHRTRLCRDFKPFKFEVTETDPSGNQTKTAGNPVR